jgi:hypothetical protein
MQLHRSLVIARPKQQNQARSVAQQRHAPCSVAPRCSGPVGDEILIRYKVRSTSSEYMLPFVSNVPSKRAGALRRA